MNGKYEDKTDQNTKPNEGKTRWFIFSLKETLYIIIILSFGIGIDFCNNTPDALQVTIMKYYDLTYFQYSLFYSLYSLPNIFHSFLGGYLIDRVFGIKKGTFVYLTVGLVGMIFFSCGSFIDTYWLMLLGRLVYGIGAEMSGTVCINYFIYSWFSSSYVNLVFSLSDNCSYFGVLLTFAVSQRIFDAFKQYYSGNTSLNITIVVTSAVYLITYGCGAAMALMNSKVKKSQSNESEEIQNQNDNQENKVNFTDCFTFPLEFWLTCFLYPCYSGGVYTIQDFEQDFLVKEFTMTINEANNVVNLLTIIQILFAIPFSIAVDRIGRNTAVVTLSVILALLSHIFVLVRVTPYVSLGLLGLSYSLMGSAIWPMFAYPLTKKHHGVGYGLVSCFSSISLTVCPMIAGRIIDAKGYFEAEYFYLALLITSLICILFVWYLDKRSTGILSMSAKQRREFQKNKY